MKAKYPLVSIFIPVYNHEDYVEQTLESVLKDTYPNKELIIIDDGSKDNSKNVIEQWIERNYKSIDFSISFICRENRGLVKTLNEGLKIINGKYYLLLASDDYLLKSDTILKRIVFFNKNSHFKAIFSDAIVVDSENRLVYESGIEGLHKSPKQKLEEYFKTDLILFWCVPGPVFMAETQYIREIGGYKEGVLVEDRYMYLRILADNKLGFFNEIVSAYRWHDQNTCGNNEQRINQEILEIEKEMLPLFKGKQKLALYATILRREWIKQKNNNPTTEQIKLREISLAIMEYLNGRPSEKYQNEIERVKKIKPYNGGE